MFADNAAAIGTVDVHALTESLAINNPRRRASAVLAALAWDRPGSEIEWSCHEPIGDIGRFTVRGYPTSASMVVAGEEEAWRLAWHGGFRWCISTSVGSLDWFDLKDRVRWHGS